MQYIDICQKVARDSGTISGDRPATVLNQTGRLGKIVHFVREAWQEIQQDRDDWQWMERSFESTLTPNAQTSTDMNLRIDDLGRFLLPTISLYDPAIGPADERLMLPMTKRIFRERYQMGVQQANRPVHVTTDHRGNLVFGPSPDKAYQVRGLYMKSPQILVLDADEPECPERFHEVIAYRASMLLGEHDEDEMATLKARRMYRNIRDDMIRSETLPVGLGLGGLS